MARWTGSAWLAGVFLLGFVGFPAVGVAASRAAEMLHLLGADRLEPYWWGESMVLVLEGALAFCGVRLALRWGAPRGVAAAAAASSVPTAILTSAVRWPLAGLATPRVALAQIIAASLLYFLVPPVAAYMALRADGVRRSRSATAAPGGVGSAT